METRAGSVPFLLRSQLHRIRRATPDGPEMLGSIVFSDCDGTLAWRPDFGVAAHLSRNVVKDHGGE